MLPLDPLVRIVKLNAFLSDINRMP